MRDFHIETIGPTGDCAVLRITGEVDAFTAPMLRERVLDLVDKGAVHLIADMGSVVFLDSTGLGVLVGTLKRLRTHGGSLMLVIGTERILRVFRITGLTSVLPPHSSLREAIAADSHWRQAIESEAGSIEEWSGGAACHDAGLGSEAVEEDAADPA
jgi:anti-sigma B factor antagonist